MESAQLFNIIIELLPANIFWKDRQGRFKGCNLTQAKNVGASSPEELIGKTVFETYKKEDQALAKIIWDIDEEIMLKKQPYVAEEKGYNANGESAVYLTHKVPVSDKAGNIVGILGVSLDITQQKKAQEEAFMANIKAKAEAEIRQAVMILSGSIAHDLRTPIAIIAGGNETIKQCLPYLIEGCIAAEKAGLIERPFEMIKPEKLQGVFALNIESADKMQGYITDSLKTLKQVVLGKVDKEDLMSCEMWHCLHSFMTHYPFENYEERQKVHCNYRYNFSFLGNQGLFERILSNLTKNSLYQMKKNGRGELFISTEEGNEGWNFLRVRDTAGGASAETVKTIFEGYRTSKAEGTGVGLGFCRLTMESFGGKITCDSVEGDYIEFLLAFPKIASCINELQKESNT